MFLPVKYSFVSVDTCDKSQLHKWRWSCVVCYYFLFFQNYLTKNGCTLFKILWWYTELFFPEIQVIIFFDVFLSWTTFVGFRSSWNITPSITVWLRAHTHRSNIRHLCRYYTRVLIHQTLVTKVLFSKNPPVFVSQYDDFDDIQGGL